MDFLRINGRALYFFSKFSDYRTFLSAPLLPFPAFFGPLPPFPALSCPLLSSPALSRPLLSEVCIFLWIRAHFEHVCRPSPFFPCPKYACSPGFVHTLDMYSGLFPPFPARSMHLPLDPCTLWTCIRAFPLPFLPEVCIFLWIHAHFEQTRQNF